MTNRYVGVLLTCEHTLWFLPAHQPRPGDDLYCKYCGGLSSVPRFDKEHGVYFPEGDWTCYGKTRVKARGVCRQCGYEKVDRFVDLRPHMEKHSRSRCVWRGDVLPFELANLPPNSPPPF